MSSSEIPCSSCNFIFNDNQLYNIHLNKCASNHNTDPKNRYYCPICNRQFRLLSNLLRHNETRKHQELLEWNVNKISSGADTDNVKTISVNLTDEDLNSISRKTQSKTFELAVDNKQNKNEYCVKNIDEERFESNDTPDDLFFSNLQNMYNEQINHPPVNHNFDSESKIKLNIETSTTNVAMEEEVHETDNFLLNLIKERDNALASFSKPKEVKTTKNKVVGFTIREDEEVNLKREIEKTKGEFIYNNTNNNNTNNNETRNETRNETINETRNENDDELGETDDLLNNIQSLRTSKMNSLYTKLDASKKINAQVSIPTISSDNNSEYPPSYHDLPIWKNLRVIIKNSEAPRLLVSLLISTPLNDYPKICTFVYFSKELKENKELKKNMVRSMIEVQNHLNKLFSQRQTVWNGKHIPLTVNLMNKWKLADFLKTL